MCLQITVCYVPVDIQVHVLTRLNWSLLLPLQWLPFITMDLAIKRMQWAPTAVGLTAKLLVLCWVKPILYLKFWSLLSHFNGYFKGQYNYYASFSFILWCIFTVADWYMFAFFILLGGRVHRAALWSTWICLNLFRQKMFCFVLVLFFFFSDKNDTDTFLKGNYSSGKI